MKLVDDAKQWYKLHSIQIGALAVVIASLIEAAPDAVLRAWMMLPQEVKAVIPEEYVRYSGIALFVLAMLARLIKQPSLSKENERTDSGNQKAD